MHRECALQYLDHVGDACAVCGETLARAAKLEALPRSTRDDRLVSRQQRRVAQMRGLEATERTRSWPRTVWPVARALLPSNVGVRTVLNRLVREDAPDFRQRALDSGLRDPDEVLHGVRWVEGKYDLLPSRLQRRMMREWKRAQPAELSW